jgi:Flp pilus assembly pilin Flp
MTKLFDRARQFYARVSRDEEGATAVEYAVMLAVILAVVAATLTSVGTEISRIWTAVLALLTTVG